MTTASLFDIADQIAPAPTTRDGANRVTWVKHYAATALAAYATFRTETRALPRNPEPGSRTDLGYLILAAVSATTAAAALVDQSDTAPKLIWDLTPEAGALNGEWEEWLADTLVRYGINPGDIDPNLDPADFTAALRTLGPSDQPYVCPDCGDTAYLHHSDCPVESCAAPQETPTPRLTITLCGSLTRAPHDLARVHRALALNGHLVHAPVPPLPDEPKPTPEQYANLVTRHHAAIRRSDLVIAICPDGQPGDATRSEMAYAQLVGRRTRWAYDTEQLLADIAAGRLDHAEVTA